MKRNQLFVIPVFAALAAAALPAAAWDNAGHSQIADIAWTKLNAATKREIGKILAAGEPKFRPTGASESSIRDAFRKTATFPDYIKGNRNTIYESMIPTMNGLFFKTAPPNPQDNEDKLCKTWHYYDVPLNDVSGHTPKESNALAALTRTQQQLGQLENTSRPNRKRLFWWLSWAEHLVGDLHQPLHCVSNFQYLPDGDEGGNLFMVQTSDQSRPVRLHGYWDGGIARAIGDDKSLGQDPTVTAVSSRWSAKYAPSATVANNTNIKSWIDAGAELAKSSVYAGIAPDSVLSPSYETAHAELCRKQATVAGYRLASMLNRLLSR